MQLSLFNVLFNLPVFLLVLFRVSSFFMVMPIIGSRFIPSRIRLAFSFVLTLVIIPLVPKMPAIPLLSLTMVLLAVKQVLVGIAAGFIFQIVFEIFLYAGQLISLQTGLGFATVMDPTSGPINMMSRVYSFAIMLVFLMLNGHLLLIQMLVNSFHTMPLMATSLSASQAGSIIQFSGLIFSGAVSITLPVLIALLLVNFTFAVMTRSAPSLNIFTVGFPITLMMGLFIIYITFTNVMANANGMFEHGYSLVRLLLGGS